MNFRQNEAARIMGREPDQIETVDYDEEDFLAMPSISGRQSVEDSCRIGQATLWASDAKLFVVYDCPAFGEPVDVIHLRYNGARGLHVDRAANEYKAHLLLRAIERWGLIASMTVSAQSGPESGADFLKVYTRQLFHGGLLDGFRARLAGWDVAPDDVEIEAPYQELLDLRSSLPAIPRPEDLWTQADIDHQA